MGKCECYVAYAMGSLWMIEDVDGVMAFPLVCDVLCRSVC